MMTDMATPVEERIVQLLRHLGISRAHFAASIPADVTGFANLHSTNGDYIFDAGLKLGGNSMPS
jgi:hypothetical protein